eukprot:CAMPEP_0203638714 /NCGR_PEP_ID=MMETSP0088-20131115/4669_1 /ASSEMBLY_ACC=CAM_ASM_001087 /TAXON_ID=426623 /ORGANISM="Chaetoceros affinis, Strain CCMP159" /LENGTH=56 /DNA_ID=CAMNT_0050493407 /DNA_START=43 /DNA_END=213 /DNA_ORIENTATION=+
MSFALAALRHHFLVLPSIENLSVLSAQLEIGLSEGEEVAASLGAGVALQELHVTGQ